MSSVIASVMGIVSFFFLFFDVVGNRSLSYSLLMERRDVKLGTYPRRVSVFGIDSTRCINWTQFRCFHLRRFRSGHRRPKTEQDSAVIIWMASNWASVMSLTFVAPSSITKTLRRRQDDIHLLPFPFLKQLCPKHERSNPRSSFCKHTKNMLLCTRTSYFFFEIRIPDQEQRCESLQTFGHWRVSPPSEHLHYYLLSINRLKVRGCKTR